ncbi:hypothetical protein [Bacillus thermotolerans]|uniref:Uncharacterized protein n=1 Tax=Bacillus thermotolerans TaxID=1221996 RepID=A0A0F5HQQ2_BACTR|nr:hypothetical protein [Bacillus thermotolerans]KKB35167.1 hypothetical protein QY95_03571 [Bacillus thermotolerans]
MADSNEKKPKLESYLVYGMVFGLFVGSIFSTIGFMLEIVFIQVAGAGIGFLLGVVIGVLLYFIKVR